MKKHKKVFKEEIEEVSIDKAAKRFFEDFEDICYEHDLDDWEEVISEYLLDKGYEFTEEEFNQISKKVMPLIEDKVFEYKKDVVENLKDEIKGKLKSWHNNLDELDDDFFIPLQLKSEDITDIVIDACREFLEDENRL